MRRVACVAIAMFSLMLAGCGQINSLAGNANDLSVAPVKVGQMQEVVVRVVNAMAQQAMQADVAKALNQFDVAAFYQPKIAQVMHGNGFVPVAYQPDLSRKLTIQINNIEYQKATGGLLAQDILKANIEADAINGVSTYSRLYRGQVSVGSVFGAGAVSAEDVKQLLTLLINQALNDPQMMRFIANTDPASGVTYQ